MSTSAPVALPAEKTLSVGRFTYGWKEEPVDVSTPIRVVRPNGTEDVQSFGGLCNQSGGALWHEFRRAGVPLV